MELFFKYVKGHRRALVAYLIFSGIFILSFYLYRLPLEAVLYPIVLCTAVAAVCITLDFISVKREHLRLSRITSASDISPSAFPTVHGVTDEDLRRIIFLLADEHRRQCKEAEQSYADMVRYYTVWAHQIKTPLASMRLHLQSEDSPLSRKLTLELHRVYRYVEMVLAFLRLNSDSTDYIFKEHDLDTLVKAVVRDFSSEFISRRLSLVYKPLNTSVITDEKWLSFVIEQVLSNALKYTHSGSVTIEPEEGNVLVIRDTGIGIAPEDLPRIFDNGYTGCNGHSDKHSSGIGLYLCRRVCRNLGHRISVTSEVGVGTAVRIDLSQRRLRAE